VPRSLIHNLPTTPLALLSACDGQKIEARKSANKVKKSGQCDKKAAHHAWCKVVENTQDVAFFIHSVLSNVLNAVKKADAPGTSCENSINGV
jgi:hypothetical protein